MRTLCLRFGARKRNINNALGDFIPYTYVPQHISYAKRISHPQDISLVRKDEYN